MRCAQSLSGRANLIFLVPVPDGKVRMHRAHFGKSLGNARHWQPVRRRYSTAQNTSYSSTLRGAVFFRALFNNGLMISNCSPFISQG